MTAGRVGEAAFSLRVAVLGLAFAVGVHIDGWAHNHDRVDQSFFTPWHAVLYGSYLVAAFYVLQRVLRARASGAAWGEAIPRGYGPTLAGIALFALAGLGDMVWHIVFGVEQSLEALLSPTHLALATGAALMATGPLVSGLRDARAGWRGSAAAVLTSAAIVSLVSFMTQFAQPLSQLWPTSAVGGFYSPDNEATAALGVTGFFWWAAVLSAVVLLLQRRRSLPPGAIVVIVGIVSVLAASQGDDWRVVLPAIAGAAVVEAVRPFLPAGRRGFRVLAGLVPAVPAGAHFVGLTIWYRVTWTVELWAGTIVGVGLVGVLTSLIVWPPDDSTA